MRSKPPREWYAQKFYETRGVLVELRKLAELARESDIDPQVLRCVLTDLVVAFHINRGVFVDFTTLRIPSLPIAELWFYGALSESQDEWVLYGNALNMPRSYTFAYPT